ncbi:MAG: hypothetical protein R3C56_15880 [Pirellulaceae bacterium]
MIADIRGNVESRIRKMHEGQFDAIILAAAGLTRLQLTEQVTQTLPQSRILPAIGQALSGWSAAMRILRLARPSSSSTAQTALLRLLPSDRFS